MRVTFVLLVAFVPLMAAPVPKTRTMAEKLEGQWELVKSGGKAPLEKHIVTFTADGVMTLDVGEGEEKRTFKGKFTATNDAIDYEMNFSTPKQEKLTIKSFDSDALKTTDPDSVEEEFKRVVKK